MRHRRAHERGSIWDGGGRHWFWRIQDKMTKPEKWDCRIRGMLVSKRPPALYVVRVCTVRMKLLLAVCAIIFPCSTSTIYVICCTYVLDVVVLYVCVCPYILYDDDDGDDGIIQLKVTYDYQEWHGMQILPRRQTGFIPCKTRVERGKRLYENIKNKYKKIVVSIETQNSRHKRFHCICSCKIIFFYPNIYRKWCYNGIHFFFFCVCLGASLSTHVDYIASAYAYYDNFPFSHT